MPSAIEVGDRRQARLGRRDLDEQVRPVDQPPQVRRPRRRSRRCRGPGPGRPRWRPGRRRPVRSYDRAQHVAGVPDVGGGDGPQRLLDAHLADGEGVQLVVVGRRAADRRGEDGRVGGDADDGVLVDQLTAGCRCGCGRGTGRRARRRPPPRTALPGSRSVPCQCPSRSRSLDRPGCEWWGSGVCQRSPVGCRARRRRRPGRSARAGGRRRPAMLSRAAATTASAVRPNSSYSTV